MDQRLGVITIGADNLPELVNFYIEKLGWQPVAKNKDIVYFKLNGFLLSILRKKLLTGFIGIKGENEFRAFTFGYNVHSKEKVTALYETLKNKNVTIVRHLTEESYGGYYFYFSDIEGNIFEVAYNPFFVLDENGNVTGHLDIDDL